MRRQTEGDRVVDLRETLPSPHGLDHGVVPVDSGVHTFLPRAVDLASVSADVGVVRLAEGHGLGAGVALLSDAGLAVALAIGDAHSSVVHEGVGREDKLDLPVSICAREQLDLEVAMLGHVLLTDEDRASVAHVSGGGAGVLVIVAVKLGHEAL